jgi:hypothetical protein
MDNLTLLIIIGIILLGAVAYIHYTMNKLQDEVKAVWLQIAVLAAATARKMAEYEQQKPKQRKKTNGTEQ